jgi:hypothetical protein
MYEIIQIMFLYFGMRYLFLTPQTNNKKLHWKLSSFISLIHAIYVTYMAIMLLMRYEYDYNKNIILQSDPEFVKVLYIIVQYMIFDLVTMIYEDNYQISFIIHHIYVIVGIIFTIYYNYCIYLAILCSLNEFSTIFLSFITLLKKYKTIQYICKQMFTISFIFSRLVLLPYIVYITIDDFDENYRYSFVFTLLIFAIHLTMNMFWFSKIIKQFIYE